MASDNASEVTSGIHVEDLTYLNVDGMDLIARLYRPKGHGQFRAVVDVHGGIWMKGDRTNDSVIAEHLAASGIIVLSLDFRRPPATPYPGPVADIASGIRWLAAHAPSLDVDPEAIFGLGCSSGGHQLMLAAMRPKDPRYRHASPVEQQLPTTTDGRVLRGLITCWGVLAPSARYEMATISPRSDILNGHHAYWPDLVVMTEGDPQLILDRSEQVSLPPLLLIQGTDDANLPVGMPERFAQSYRAAGGDVRVELFEGEAHNFINSEPDSPASKTALGQIVEFVQSR